VLAKKLRLIARNLFDFISVSARTINRRMASCERPHLADFVKMSQVNYLASVFRAKAKLPLRQIADGQLSYWLESYKIAALLIVQIVCLGHFTHELL
jgi:hypothetical protein